MQTKSGRERIFCARFPSVGFLLTTSHLKRDTWSIKSFYYSINTLFVEPQLDGILEKWVFEYVKDEYSTMLSFGGTSKRFQFGHITGQLAFERLGNYVLRYNWFKLIFAATATCHIQPCSKSPQLLQIHYLKLKLCAKRVLAVREWFKMFFEKNEKKTFMALTTPL